MTLHQPYQVFYRFAHFFLVLNWITSPSHVDEFQFFFNNFFFLVNKLKRKFQSLVTSFIIIFIVCQQVNTKLGHLSIIPADDAENMWQGDVKYDQFMSYN